MQMQLFSDFSFFIWVAVLMVPALIIGIMEKPLKYYGFALTILFIWFAMGHNTRAMLYLAGFVLWELVLIKLYLRVRQARGRNSSVYYVFLLLSIMPLIANKFLSAIGNPYHILGFLGISYMTFKAAQIIIEIYDGVIKEVRVFDYVYLMLFFPAILSGPIDRSRRFKEDLDRKLSKDEYLDMFGTGLMKFMVGFVYKQVLGTGMYQLMVWFGLHQGLKAGLIYMYTYGFYLFFDFAGYSMMAIGTSYMLGIRTPENFNKPFVSKDIKEFWNRWHITLSHWFRDFVFSRITMDMIRHRLFKKKLQTASAAFIINMLIMGLWHGFVSYYILYGLYHGVLLALTEVFQKKSKFYKKHKKDRWFIVLEWFITFNLVMFGFMIFSGRLNTLLMK